MWIFELLRTAFDEVLLDLFVQLLSALFFWVPA